MNEQAKKIILVTLFAIVAGLAGYMLWLMFAEQSATPNDNQQPSGNNVNLPASGPNTGIIPVNPNPEGNLPNTNNQPINPNNNQGNDTGRDNKISSPNNFPVVNPTLNGDGSSVQYYDPLDNKFYRVDEDGTPRIMTDKQFYNVRDVSWSPDKNSAILEYPDGSKNIYNFSDQSQISLPKHWEEFQFSPSGEQIAFKSIGYEPDNRWLSIMNADGTGAKNLEKLGENADKAIINWSPNRQIVAQFQESSDYNRQQIIFIGLNQENFKALTVQGRGFQSKWSPDGNQLLYSVYTDGNGYKPSLWISNANGDSIGQNNRPLEIATWAEKCSFANDTTVYCAVPRSLADGSGWLPVANLEIVDDLYSIDLASGAKTLLRSEGAYNMTDLMITKDGRAVYFKDYKTGGLYKLDLQ